MDQFPSPDLPAWVCYVVVLIVGMVGARSSVKTLLADQRGYWGIANTWALFWAYAVIPVVLFWSLDYTSALRDTSLFAALVVAFGYRQIFQGGVQGIVASGPTASFWKPFEAWANRISQTIAARNKSVQDLFDENVKTHLASDPARLAELLRVTCLYTKDSGKLAAALATLAAMPSPAAIPAAVFQQWKDREQVRILLDNLRASQPEHYGVFLYQEGLIERWRWINWREGWRSKLISRMMIALIVLVFGAVGLIAYNSESIPRRYHHWRFAKANASEKDRFRSREYLGKWLVGAAASKDGSRRIELVTKPLLTRLRFKETTPTHAESILRLLVDFHSPSVDAATIPPLIEALRTENADVRLRIHRGLLELRAADFTNTILSPTTEKWSPAKDEMAGAIDTHVRAWQAWWMVAQQPRPEPPASSTSQPAR